ncbi:GNAT family N-acetyltransferase [Endozoicomonas arenosclerae]|uniref:GNAT family N-acetyltransferase n=1 Tax=Endozoicomonas arenosclerae TaxID=1633495 RepID=UPI000A52D49A|nr:GNAT family N-acetyltransferase [Endozoicomonas arenosclerae]
MNEAEFSDYLETAIPAYAKSNVDSGRWHESEALDRSRKTYNDLLPVGKETENNYFYHVIEDVNQQKVGQIWVKIIDNIHTRSAFIYDIKIDELYQRKGYAKSALNTLESIVASFGASSLGLHVFSQNSAAIRLYNSVGFQTVSLNMQKNIEVASK